MLCVLCRVTKLNAILQSLCYAHAPPAPYWKPGKMVHVTASIIEQWRGVETVLITHLPSAIEVFQKYSKNSGR